MTEWLAENPELLDVALEIVDAWEIFSGYQPACESWAAPTPDMFSRGSEYDQSDTISLSSTSSSDPSDALDSPRPAESQPLSALAGKAMKIEKNGAIKQSTRTSTQYRRRAEIDHLRITTAELERQLKQIIAAKQTHGSISMEGSRSPQGRAVRWRDIAHHQQKLRNLSELAHAKLRRRVQTQLRMARRVAKLIEKVQTVRLIIQPIEMPIGPPDIECNMSALDFTEAEQFRRVISIHEKLDDFFSGPEFHTGNIDELDIRLVHDRHDQYAVEVSEAWAVPFDHRRMMDALWHFCVLKQQNKWCAPALVQNSNLRVEDSELISEIHGVASLGSARGCFDGRVITKRFGGPSPAIVSDFCSASSELDPGAFAGMRSEEQVCLRVLPTILSVPGGSTNNSGTRVISRVQFRQRFTIAFIGDHNHASLFADMVLGKMRDCLQLMRETVETTLLLEPSLIDT